MEDLKLLSLNELFELLIEQTSYHTHLITVGANAELFRNSSKFLEQLQTEIRMRKASESEQALIS